VRAGLCTVKCLRATLTPCATNSGPFCANLNTNPNFCGSCNTTCPSDLNNQGTRVCTDGTCGVICNRNYPTQCGNPSAGLSLCVNLQSSVTNW
jgi:hypothetical protein